MGRQLNRFLPAAVLAGLCALVFFLRLHTYDEPLERDLTTYAVIAHEMLDGKALYSDLWDHKPPAIHVTYAAAESVAGYGRDSIFLMNMVGALGILLAVYFAGCAAGGGKIGGLVAAGIWALAAGDLALEGNQPNTELFLNLFLAAGFVVFIRAEKKGLGWKGALLAGCLFALASLYKQVAAVPAALIAFTYLASARPDRRRRALAEAILVGAIGAMAWALVFAYFFARGHGQAFFDAVFNYNRYYSGSIWRNLTHAPEWSSESLEQLAVLFPIGILCAAGIVLGLIFGPRRPWVFLLAFAAGAQVAVRLPGHAFPHYYQLWLPPLVIGAGWSVALLQRTLPVRLAPLSYGTAGVVCLVLLALEWPCYKLPAADWSVKKYGGIFLETEQLAGRIDKLLAPGESFYEWGSESGLYFTSGRQPLSGIVFADPVLSGPEAQNLCRRLLSELERSRPDLVVVNYSTLHQTAPGHPMLGWLQQNYRPLAEADLFLLLARKDSRLDPERKSTADEAPDSPALARDPGNLRL